MHTQRLYSRGNTAIAALLMVVLVGVGATALNSVQGQNKSSQLAQAPTATSDKGFCTTFNGQKICEKDNLAQKCTLGYDYLIKMMDAEDSTGRKMKRGFIFATKDDKVPLSLGTPGQQCISSTGGVAVVPQRANDTFGSIPARQCVSATWKCYVTFCKPRGFTPELLKQPETCITLQPVGVGQEMKADTVVGEHFGEDIKAAALSPDPEVRKNALPYIPALPSTMGSGLLGSFDTAIADQRAREDEASEVYNAAIKLFDECEEDCKEASDLQDRAEIVYGAEKEKREALEATRDQAAALAGGASVLTPTTLCKPGEACYTGGNPDSVLTPVSCEVNKNQEKCKSTTFNDQSTGRTPPNPDTKNGTLGGLGSLGQYLPLVNSLLSGLGNAMRPGPSCTLKVSAPSVAKAGDPVTLSWTSQNAQSAYLSIGGQVGPSGSMTVNPQQATTYTMQVMGFPPQQQQQGYNPYNPYGQTQQDPVCYTSYNPVAFVQQPAVPGCLNYRATQSGGNSYTQLGQQIGQLFGGSGSTAQQATCEAKVGVGTDAGGDGSGGEVKAQISCQPRIADVGMQVAVSFACQNAATAGGSGFSTDGKLSGSATIDVKAPPLGSTSNTYGITCSNQGKTDSAQCVVGINSPSIVLVANPKDITAGESVNLGWISSAMEGCVISSDDLAEFTNGNKSQSTVSGAVKSPALSKTTKFTLSCTTKAGGIKKAETIVEVSH